MEMCISIAWLNRIDFLKEGNFNGSQAFFFNVTAVERKQDAIDSFLMQHTYTVIVAIKHTQYHSLYYYAILPCFVTIICNK